MKNLDIQIKLNSAISCLMAHPDNEPDSEFADRINDLIDIKDSLLDNKNVSDLIELKNTFIYAEYEDGIYELCGIVPNIWVEECDLVDVKHVKQYPLNYVSNSHVITKQLKK